MKKDNRLIYMRFRLPKDHANMMRRIADEDEDGNLSKVSREAVKVYLYGRGYKQVMTDEA